MPHVILIANGIVISRISVNNEFNLIFRKFLADFKNFSELCDEVCMYAIIVLRCLGTAKLLKIQ